MANMEESIELCENVLTNIYTHREVTVSLCKHGDKKIK